MKNIILSFLSVVSIISFAKNNDSIQSKPLQNTITLFYSPSFSVGNGIKNVFHGIEINYERRLINRLSLSVTQGYYSTTNKDISWSEVKNSTINYFAAKRKDYYLQTHLSFNVYAYYNKFYELKFGIGPTLMYRNTIKIKSSETNYDYNEQFFDKGVLGGLNISVQNDFTIKKHLFLSTKFQSHVVFSKKNTGDKLIILRPGFGIGYKF